MSQRLPRTGVFLRKNVTFCRLRKSAPCGQRHPTDMPYRPAPRSHACRVAGFLLRKMGNIKSCQRHRFGVVQRSRSCHAVDHANHRYHLRLLHINASHTKVLTAINFNHGLAQTPHLPHGPGPVSARQRKGRRLFPDLGIKGPESDRITRLYVPWHQ